MKTLITCLIAACIVGSAFAAKPPPPSPENQAYSMWYGEWKGSREYFDTPLGPGSKFSTTSTVRPVLNGNGIELVLNDGGYRGHEIAFWDPAVGRYGYFYLGEDGYNEVGYYDIVGTTAMSSFTMEQDGITYLLEGSEPFSRDGRVREYIIWLSWTDTAGQSHRMLYAYGKSIKVKPGCPNPH